MSTSSAAAPGLSASLEDYLEAIFRLAQDHAVARARDIAARLGVNQSSVTNALRALAEKKLVHYSPYDYITLTRKGGRAARDVARRHEALREFFVRVLAVDAAEAESAACKMEHTLSPELRRRLTAFARFMEQCPLGRPEWTGKGAYRCDARARCAKGPVRRKAPAT